MSGDKIEHENIGDALKSSPFSIFNIFKGFTGGAGSGAGAETGGGMGAAYNPELAQKIINTALSVPIYPTSALG